MPRSVVACLLMLGLLLNGCAGRQATVRPDNPSGEAICWDPPPASSAHPVCDWCKAHPWTVGIGAGVLTVCAIAAAGLYLGLSQFGGGLGSAG